ncbi:MAG: response regulator transcription factor [Armatimonadota bacterium]|nr:response regulator transcription factor [bacterium]
MNEQIMVLVVDTHPIIRWALRNYLDNEAGIGVVGEADSVEEAARLVETYRPDVVVTDLDFADISVPTLMGHLGSVPARTVAFSARDTWDQVEKFLEAGGLAFVSKCSPLTEVISAIRAAQAGRRWISPSLRQPARQHRLCKAGSSADELSQREREVVSLIAQGLTSRQIADQLCLSHRTIENHRHRIFKKLGITRSAQLVDYAIRHGIKRNSGRSDLA